MKTHISRTTWRPCESESVRRLCGAAPAVWHECGTTYINLELGAIRVLDGGIIALDPLVVHELGCRPCELLQEDGEPALVRLCGCGEEDNLPVKQLLPTPPEMWRASQPSANKDENKGDRVGLGMDGPAPRTTTCSSRLWTERVSKMFFGMRVEEQEWPMSYLG